MIYHHTARRRRQLVLFATAIGTLVAILLATSVMLNRGPAGTATDQAAGAATIGPEASPPEAGSVAAAERPGSGEPVVLELVGHGGPGEPGPGSSPIPFEQPEEVAIDPESPCAQAGPNTSELHVQPSSVVLMDGRGQGSVDIRNCDSVAVDWSAATEAWVTLDDSSGQLPSGATFRLAFTVDPGSLPAGAYAFQIEISRPGHTAVVDVSGTKLDGFAAPGAAPPPEPVIGGLVDSGHAGCGAQCITKAWLSARPSGADVSLEVTTLLPATITAQVSTDAPKYSADGTPSFASPAVSAASDAPAKSWVTTLSPLQPATSYHIIVAAENAGGVSYRTGTFTTAKAPAGLADQAPAGCLSNCIERAVLTPTPGGFDAEVSVEAHVPVKLRVAVDGATAATSGGEFVTAWSATLELEAGTTYQVTLEVTDEQGHSQQHEAQFTTPKPLHGHHDRVQITFHQIWVTDDADNSFLNQTGEITFRFEVNGVRGLDTGERKVKAPTWVSLDQGGRSSGRSMVVENPPDLLPVRVQAQERDKNQPGFCSAGSPIFEETSGRKLIPRCYVLEWNTAEGPIDLHSSIEGQALPECYGFPEGIRGDRCVVLHATGPGPTFDVYVTIDFLDD